MSISPTRTRRPDLWPESRNGRRNRLKSGHGVGSNPTSGTQYPGRQPAAGPQPPETTMAAGNTTTEIRCPACQAELTIPLTLTVVSRGNATITANTAAVLAHVDQCPGPATPDEPAADGTG